MGGPWCPYGRASKSTSLGKAGSRAIYIFKIPDSTYPLLRLLFSPVDPTQVAEIPRGTSEASAARQGRHHFATEFFDAFAKMTQIPGAFQLVYAFSAGNIYSETGFYELLVITSR